MDKTSVNTSETWNYSVHVTTSPKESAFSKYEVKDTLQDEITLAGNEEDSLTVTDAAGNDISERFTRRFDASSNTVTITALDAAADELYGTTIKMGIHVRLKDATAPVLKNPVENNAVFDNGGKTLTSNTVKTNIRFRVDTEVVNGTITPTQRDIPHGDDRKITYAPNPDYFLKSITVDGQAVTIEDYQDAYDFNDINQNHKIKVVYERIPKRSVGVTKVWKDGNLSLIHISEPTRRRGISYCVFCG